MANLQVIYDLGENPASYDFPTFLCHVEKIRRNTEHPGLDVHFMPGRQNRFYDRYFPKDNERREGLLWRVCVPSCQFVDSVRSVIVHNTREKVDGCKYPGSWDVGSPTQDHGSAHMRDPHRCLHASKWAKSWVAAKYREPFVAITIRECDYEVHRNSNREQWRLSAKHIAEKGFKIVWVPDTYGSPMPEHENCIEATVDIDIRLALYERASLCMGVANGPITLAMLGDCAFMSFNNDYMCGWNFDNGNCYREKDTRDIICEEFDRFYKKAHAKIAAA